VTEGAQSAVKLEVFSDFLCPWCHLAAHRLKALETEFADRLTLSWRAFLLRPHPEEGRDLHKFVRYTQGWLRPAGEPDAPRFRVWETSEGPPTHSIPAHVAAKAAQALGDGAGRAMHERLLRAYFEENRDISREGVLRELWREVGLAEDSFPAGGGQALARRVVDDHNEAVELGITGVPAVRIAGSDAFVMGAQPLEVYRRWVTKLTARAEQGA
jgi:predicted DsbA family dithiol-disulfide isomerase